MKLEIQPTVEWDSITHQEQPTNSTCVHACLAMALGVPVATVVDVVGSDALGQLDLHLLLERWGVVWNVMVYPRIVFRGWHFATVPSLNNKSGSHMILIWYDPMTGGMMVMDPSSKKRYKPDGSDLKSWSELIVFYPGGRIKADAPVIEHAAQDDHSQN